VRPDIRPRPEGNSTARRTMAEETDMVLVLSIAAVWLLGSLLVLGLCAAAADGDRALAEQAV